MPRFSAYVGQCILPCAPDPGSLEDIAHRPTPTADLTEVSAVIAIDGGYTETFVREDYPSACIAFFTFGPLLFNLADLRALSTKRFIAPEDLHKLKQIERYTLVLPTKGIRHSAQPSLAATIRRAVYDFFERTRGPEGDQLLASLKWFLFRRWKRQPDETIRIDLEHCPYRLRPWLHIVLARRRHVKVMLGLRQACLSRLTRFGCMSAWTRSMGGSGIAAYVMTMLEQLVLVHLITTPLP